MLIDFSNLCRGYLAGIKPLARYRLAYRSSAFSMASAMVTLSRPAYWRSRSSDSSPSRHSEDGTHHPLPCYRCGNGLPNDQQPHELHHRNGSQGYRKGQVNHLQGCQKRQDLSRETAGRLIPHRPLGTPPGLPARAVPQPLRKRRIERFATQCNGHRNGHPSPGQHTPIRADRDAEG